MIAGGMDEKYKSGRFMYINAWRNISDTPIGRAGQHIGYTFFSGNDHLAVYDETSLVKPDNYIVADLFDKTYR